MINKFFFSLLCISFIPAYSAFAAEKKQGAFVDSKILQKIGVAALALEPSSGVGYALLSDSDQNKISEIIHSQGGCGGYELQDVNFTINDAKKSLAKLKIQVERDRKQLAQKLDVPVLEAKPELLAALAQLKEDNLKNTIAWMSAFPSRDHRKPDPNQHVLELERRTKILLQDYAFPYSIDLINHRKTKQKSLRVRLIGTDLSDEIIVLGGHYDSINHQKNGFNRVAPGSDDNASGSANLLEALRVVIMQNKQTRRTLDFIWYAAEETGLVGSGEIAATYRSLNQDVVAALQLDMNLFPGNGVHTIANTMDFTSPWLQAYLREMNRAYLKIRLIERTCGYACSDHASWYRQKYPSLMPFEAARNYNKNIHSEADIVDSRSNFSHALNFGKITLIMALDLGNRNQRPPMNDLEPPSNPGGSKK